MIESISNMKKVAIFKFSDYNFQRLHFHRQTFPSQGYFAKG